MNNFEFDTSNFLQFIANKQDDIRDETKKRAHDIADDLARIAVDIAPIKSSNLRGSVDTVVKENKNNIVAEVSFSVINEEDNYNYALRMHEEDYNLGEKSKQAHGTDGYQVGNKYLERPLYGEKDKYFNWYTQGVVDGINK